LPNLRMNKLTENTAEVKLHFPIFKAFQVLSHPSFLALQKPIKNNRIMSNVEECDWMRRP
jgi:hypothetical protein